MAQNTHSVSDKERLIGAWHLVRIEAGAPNENAASAAQPEGMLIYTGDGHVSVQLMYAGLATALSNEYVKLPSEVMR